MTVNVLKVSRLTITAFILPSLLIYIGIVFIPILVSFYSGLLDWNGISDANFVGFSNYKTLFLDDPIFWPSVRRTLMFAVFSMAEIPLALLIAILLKRYVRKPNFLVSSYFMPVILSVVIIGQLWKTIYNPLSMGGMLNQMLSAVGLEAWAKPWLTDPSVAMIALYFVALWQYLGYHTLIQYTGITNIPTEIYEAARIDGADGFKADLYITLPMIIPIFKISIVLAFIGSLQAFDMIMVMTGGGPAHATDVISTHMYNMSFLSMKYGYGSAIASFLVVLCLFATALINYVFTKLDKHYS
jgi:raffinose/stachyose/melibiose transport system permease protein